MSDTPEVDSECDDEGVGGYESAYKDMRDLARRLERERDAARREVERRQNEIQQCIEFWEAYLLLDESEKAAVAESVDDWLAKMAGWLK